jgi:hypothetical protein
MSSSVVLEIVTVYASKFGVETTNLLLLPIESSDGALRGINTDSPNYFLSLFPQSPTTT